MLIKIGYSGRIQEPHENTNIFKNEWLGRLKEKTLSTQGIVFRCETVGDEQLLETLIDLLSKYPSHVINDYLISKRQ